VSFDRIAELLAEADNHTVQANLTRDGGHLQTARRLRSMADDIAAATKLGVEHPEHGYGVCVGVTRDGLLEVVFGGDEWAVALPIDQVREATW
jgi:hypothetical protein